MLDKNIQTNMGLAYDQINAELNGLSDVSKLFDVQPSLNKNAILDVYVEKGKIYTDSIGIISINALGVSAIYTVDANGNYVTFIGSTKVLFSIGNITVTSLAVPNTSIIIYVIIDLLRIESTSNFKSKLSLNAFVYHSGFIGSLLKSNETLQYNSINKFLINQAGYSLNGIIAILTSGTQFVSGRIYASEGEVLIYSGGFTFACVIGFTETGYIELVPAGTYTRRSVTVPAGVVYAVANNNTTLFVNPIFKKKTIYDSDDIVRRLQLNEDNINTLIPANANLILKDCVKSGSASLSNLTDRSIDVNFSGLNKYVKFATQKNLTTGEFGFCRINLKVNISGWFFLAIYTNAAEQTSQEYYFESGVVYDIYLKQNNVITGGAFNFIIYNYNIYAVNVNINDVIFTFNSFDAYYDHNTKASLKNFYTKNIIVDKSGVDCHFTSINSALSFLKSAYNVLTTSCTIFVKPGIYDKEFRVGKTEGYPNAAVYKGGNLISMVGTSKYNTIIRHTNSANNRLKVLDIGGECVIKGFTIESLNDGTYIDNSAGGHQACYCIHNDSEFTSLRKYTTAVEDINVYSECNSPIGAGLHNNQNQLYRNVNSISNSKNNTSLGACYIHNSSSAEDTGNMSIELINNEFISKDGTYSIVLPDTGLGDDFSIIPCVFQKNLLYSSGISETNVTDATHLIEASSKLNSNSVLNK